MNQIRVSKESISPTTSPKKSTSQYNSFNLNSSLTKRDFKTKGKEMWQLKSTRKELDEKIKNLQNRINFLNSEQERTEKTITLTKRKHESFSKLRDGVTQEKLKINEFKIINEKKLLAQKQENLSKTKELQEKIKAKKAKIVEENLTQRANMVKNIRESHEQVSKELEADQKRKKFLTSVLHDTIKKIHHRKTSSFQCLIQQKELEYTLKLQKELELQDKAKEQISFLEKLETEYMEKLQSTQKMQQTVNSILSSPVNKSFNFLNFNL